MIENHGNRTASVPLQSFRLSPLLRRIKKSLDKPVDFLYSSALSDYNNGTLAQLVRASDS